MLGAVSSCFNRDSAAVELNEVTVDHSTAVVEQVDGQRVHFTSLNDSEESACRKFVRKRLFSCVCGTVSSVTAMAIFLHATGILEQIADKFR